MLLVERFITSAMSAKYALRREDVPEKTLFLLIITTDGLENASHYYIFYDTKSEA